MAPGSARTARHEPPAAVWQAITDQRRSLWTILGFSFAINLLGLTSSLYMLQIYDRVLSSYSVDTLIALTVIAFIALGAMTGLEGVRSLLLQRLGARVSDQLGGTAFKSQLKGATSEGPSIQPLRDLETIRSAIGSQTAAVACDLPWSPIYFLLLFWLHPVIFWAAVAIGLCLFAVAYANDRTNAAASAKNAVEHLKAMQFAESATRSGEAMIAMGAAGNIASTWQKRTRDAVIHTLDTLERESLLSALSRFLRLFLQVGLLGLGAALALSGELSVGGIIAGSILGARAVTPIDGIIGSWKTVLAAREAARRLDVLYAAQPDTTDAMQLPAPLGRISAEGIAVAPPGAARPLFARLSFQLEPGEQMAIIGPSGTGKSTLVRAIVGLVPCAVGKIRIDGAEVVQWQAGDLGRWIGYLPQAPLPIGGTLAQNIARFAAADAEAVVQAAKDAGAHDLILSLPQGYDTPIGIGGIRLSGGQMQRVALATALYSRPPVVVLDEPESHLDGDGESELRAVLQGLRERRVTVIVVSHRPSAVAVMDKVLLLRGGTGEFGPRDEMLRRVMRAANPIPAKTAGGSEAT
jgi:PrtD family type I secretion system ABC transporter